MKWCDDGLNQLGSSNNNKSDCHKKHDDREDDDNGAQVEWFKNCKSYLNNCLEQEKDPAKCANIKAWLKWCDDGLKNAGCKKDDFQERKEPRRQEDDKKHCHKKDNDRGKRDWKDDRKEKRDDRKDWKDNRKDDKKEECHKKQDDNNDRKDKKDHCHKNKEHGNNGLGNGIDQQPPGKPPINDGQGTSKGNPGNKGHGKIDHGNGKGNNGNHGNNGKGNQGNGNNGNKVKGNNGVGNGIDAQPRGNPPINDGKGTSKGNPGNKGHGKKK